MFRDDLRGRPLTTGIPLALGVGALSATSTVANPVLLHPASGSSGTGGAGKQFELLDELLVTLVP